LRLPPSPATVTPLDDPAISPVLLAREIPGVRISVIRAAPGLL
jgi:hypothetical protein